MLHRAGLSPAAKRGHLWERAFEVGQKNTAQAEDGRGEKWAAVTSTPSWKQEEGEEVLPEPRFLAAPGGIHSSKQDPPNRTLSLWKTHTGFIPKALQLMKRSQAEAGAGTAEPTTAVTDWPPFPEEEAEETGVKVWRNRKGGWCFTVFDFVSHYAVLIGNELKSLLLSMVTGKHSSHLSQPMKISLFFPNQLRCWGEWEAGWAHLYQLSTE